MVVARRGHGSGKSLTSGVDSLPDIVTVDAPCNLLDQHRGNSVGSKLFMCTEEINFGHQNGFSKDRHVNRNACDARVEVSLVIVTYSNNPFGKVARRIQSPLEEICRVIKTEFTMGVLHIVVLKQVVELKNLILVFHIYLRPSIARR